MKKKEKVFRCYSVPLKEFLLTNGVEYLTIALDCKSHNTMWIFLRDELLDGLLTKWSNSNPRKQV